MHFWQMLLSMSGNIGEVGYLKKNAATHFINAGLFSIYILKLYTQEIFCRL